MQSCLSSLLLLLLHTRPSAPPLKPPPAVTPHVEVLAATLPGSSRPSALHPWKKWSTCGLKSVATNVTDTLDGTSNFIYNAIPLRTTSEYIDRRKTIENNIETVKQMQALLFVQTAEKWPCKC